jgi:hypothetical protein
MGYPSTLTVPPTSVSSSLGSLPDSAFSSIDALEWFGDRTRHISPVRTRPFRSRTA